MFQFMVFNNPAWDYKTLNFDQDMAKVAAIEKGDINVLQPNLDKFAARGGKLIQYHGWADQQIPSGSSTRFFTSLVDRTPVAASKLEPYYRLFMVPAMGHCGGGAGTTTFDMLAALEQWVEQGKAPNSIPAVACRERQDRANQAAVPVSAGGEVVGPGQLRRRGQLQLQSSVTQSPDPLYLAGRRSPLEETCP